MDLPPNRIKSMIFEEHDFIFLLDSKKFDIKLDKDSSRIWNTVYLWIAFCIFLIASPSLSFNSTKYNPVLVTVILHSYMRMVVCGTIRNRLPLSTDTQVNFLKISGHEIGEV